MTFSYSSILFLEPYMHYQAMFSLFILVSFSLITLWAGPGSIAFILSQFNFQIFSFFYESLTFLKLFRSQMAHYLLFSPCSLLSNHSPASSLINKFWLTQNCRHAQSCGSGLRKAGSEVRLTGSGSASGFEPSPP